MKTPVQATSSPASSPAAADPDGADDRAAADPREAAAAAPRAQITLIGGDADGRRVDRPEGKFLIVDVEAGGREAYRERTVFTRDGQPVGLWVANALTDTFGLAILRDGYRGSARPDRPKGDA